MSRDGRQQDKFEWHRWGFGAIPKKINASARYARFSKRRSAKRERQRGREQTRAEER